MTYYSIYVFFEPWKRIHESTSLYQQLPPNHSWHRLKFHASPMVSYSMVLGQTPGRPDWRIPKFLVPFGNRTWFAGNCPIYFDSVLLKNLYLYSYRGFSIALFDYHRLSGCSSSKQTGIVGPIPTSVLAGSRPIPVPANMHLVSAYKKLLRPKHSPMF